MTITTKKSAAVSRLHEAARLASLSPAQIDSLAHSLEGGGVFHVVEASMKAALLDAARLLRPGRRPAHGSTAPASTTHATKKTLAIEHDERIRAMRDGFTALASGDAVKTLTKVVDTSFDAPERAEGRRSYRWTSALPLVSYAPDRDGATLHDTRRSVGRVETSLVSDDVIVVVTREGLREVGGFGLDTRPVDPVQLAAHGISLELLDKRVKAVLRDAVRDEAWPIDVPMSDADRAANP